MGKLALIFAIICAVQSVIYFAISNYFSASTLLVATVINLISYFNYRKVM